MSKVIVLNAPPASGKDTIASILSLEFDCGVASFKYAMFNIARAMLGQERYEQFIAFYDDRDQKEKPHDILGGKSCREFMIWISESVIKPVFGSDHFGKLASYSIEGAETDIVFSDGGFPDEVKTLVNEGHEVHLVRLWRKGYTFGGDSRDYITICGMGGNYHEHDVKLIDGQPMKAAMEIAELVGIDKPERVEDDIPW